MEVLFKVMLTATVAVPLLLILCALLEVFGIEGAPYFIPYACVVAGFWCSVMLCAVIATLWG